MVLNSLADWIEPYLAAYLGEQEGFEYSPGTLPEGTGTLVTIGFMPEQPTTLVTLTGYDFPERTAPGTVTAYLQVRARATTRQAAIRLAHTASQLLLGTPRLDQVSRLNLEPIGQDQTGAHEATANILINTIERP